MHNRHRPLRWLLGALGIVVLAVFLGIVAIALIKPSTVVAQIRQHALPRLSQSLGRPVQAGEIRIAWFPPRADLKNLSIGGRPGEPPLVVVPEARASLRLWTLLSSGGRDVSLRSVDLLRPRINLVRERDGSWSSQGLLGSGADGEQSGRQVLVSDLHIRDGALYVIDRSGPRPDKAVAMTHIDMHARDAGGPAMRLDVAAALASEKPNLAAKLVLRKGAWSGMLTLAALPVTNLRGLLPAGLDAALTGGSIALQADLATRQDGARLVEGHVDAPGLVLRGAQASSAFDFVATLPPGAAGAPTVEINNVRLSGAGVADLTGEASVRGKPLAATFSLSGPLLNLDALMGELSPTQQAPTATSGALPASLRQSIASIVARGRIKVDTLILKKLSAHRVVADAQLQGGVVTITSATAELYGGALSATGSTLDLRQPLPRWELRGQLQGVDLAAAMQQVTGTSPLAGRADGRIHLRGQGDQWRLLQKSMTGAGTFKVSDGELRTADLAQALSEPIAAAVKRAGKSGALAQGGSGGSLSTPLEGLQGSFTIESGRMYFTRPVVAHSSFGEVSLGGSVGLDQQLDFKGTAHLAPNFLAQAAGFNPGKPIAAPMEVTGSLSAPQVHIDTGAVAKGMLRQSPSGKIFRGLHGLFGGGSQVGLLSAGHTRARPKLPGTRSDGLAEAQGEPIPPFGCPLALSEGRRRRQGPSVLSRGDKQRAV